MKYKLSLITEKEMRRGGGEIEIERGRTERRKTVDTNVVLLVICFSSILKLEELWVSYNTRKYYYSLISAHDIAIHLGPQLSKALIGFYSFTGCDTFLLALGSELLGML